MLIVLHKSAKRTADTTTTALTTSHSPLDLDSCNSVDVLSTPHGVKPNGVKVTKIPLICKLKSSHSFRNCSANLSRKELELSRELPVILATTNDELSNYPRFSQKEPFKAAQIGGMNS